MSQPRFGERAARDRDQRAALVTPRQEPETRDSARLLPLDRSSKPFEIVSGEDSGRHVRMTLRHSPRDPGNWALTLGEYYRLHLTRSDEGEVVCRRLDILNRNQGVLYEPPVRLLPARVRAAERSTARGSARVVDLNSGRQTRAGTYEHALVSISRTTLDVPAGTTDGYFIEFSHAINLDLADITIDLELGTTLERGEGLVYIRIKNTVEKLGLFGDTTIREFACSRFQGETDRSAESPRQR